MEWPLISVVMTCYNQEHVVADALASVLGQDCAPLEIVVSDDCSADDSFGVVERTVAAYDGPHRVIAHRNERTLGIAGNFDRVCSLSTGEFLVFAAGDDWSVPNRVARVVDRWLASDRRAHVVHSACTVVDGHDRPVRTARPPAALRHGTPSPLAMVTDYLYAIGAAMAFSRQCLTDFGPVSEHALIEDHVIPFRAALSGEIAYLDEPLVRKRPGGVANLEVAGTTYDEFFGLYLKELPWVISDLRQFEADLRHVDRSNVAEVRTAIRRRLALHEFEQRMATASTARRLAMVPGTAATALRRRDRHYLKRGLIYAGAPWSIRSIDALRRGRWGRAASGADSS